MSARVLHPMKITESTIIIGLVWILSAEMALACSAPTPPEIPDPATAVLPEMVKAQNEVKRYLADAENYLKCEKNSRKYDSVVDAMHVVGDTFNKAISEFKAQMKKNQ